MSESAERTVVRTRKKGGKRAAKNRSAKKSAKKKAVDRKAFYAPRFPFHNNLKNLKVWDFMVREGLLRSKGTRWTYGRQRLD